MDISFGDPRLPESFWRLFMEVTIVDHLGPCWYKIENPGTSGYGYVRHEGRTMLAHDLTFRTFIDPTFPVSRKVGTGVPVLAHYCDVRRCANPTHVRPATPAENSAEAADAISRGRIAAERRNGLCRNGLHQMTPDNIYEYTKKSTGRTSQACRACRLESQRRHDERKRDHA